MRADPLAHAGHQVAHGLRRRDDVERRRQRALVVKVAQPQFGAGKLPLLVLVVLPKPKRRKAVKPSKTAEMCEWRQHSGPSALYCISTLKI